MKHTIFLVLMTSIFISCSKSGDDALVKQADIQAQEGIRAQNQNQREWSDRMESDLNVRKKFIEAIEGNFYGEIKLLDINFLMNVQIIPSIPVEYPNRVRTFEEINFELQNLNLNIHIKLENPRVNNSAVSCVVTNYRPDVKNGLMTIISETCKNIFQFNLSDNQNSSMERGERSRRLSRDIRDGYMTRVEVLEGYLETSVSSVKHYFKLGR